MTENAATISPSPEDEKKTDFLKRFPPAKKEDLPTEERWQLEETGEKPVSSLTKEELELINTNPNPKRISENEGISKYLREEGLKNYQHWSQSDTFHIEMKDGSFQKYVRRSISDDEFEEIEDLRAEAEGGMEINSGRTLNRMEIRQREKLLEKKKAEYYLINTKTKQPMTSEEKRNIRHAYVINGILNYCILRSKSDAVEGKN